MFTYFTSFACQHFIRIFFEKILKMGNLDQKFYLNNNNNFNNNNQRGQYIINGFVFIRDNPLQIRAIIPQRSVVLWSARHHCKCCLTWRPHGRVQSVRVGPEQLGSIRNHRGCSHKVFVARVKCQIILLAFYATRVQNDGHIFCGVIYASNPGFCIALTRFACAKRVKQ